MESGFYQGGRAMEKYDCKNCVHSTKGSVFNNPNPRCKHCTVDSKDLKGKPSAFVKKGDK